MKDYSIKERIINTIMAVVVAIMAGLLVYVCDTFTVPAIATWITVALCGVAGWAIYRVCKMWILKGYEKWNLKRKQ